MSTNSISSDFIKDNPSPFLYGLFSRFIVQLFKRNYKSVQFHLPYELDSNSSYLFLMNHFSWWDGILPMFLHTKVFPNLNAKGIMEEDQLKKRLFFTKFHVFSVNRTNSRKAIASIRYANEHLSKKGTCLFLFPQGGIYPNDVSFFQIESGYQHICKGLTNVRIIPLISYAETMYHKKQTMWIRFGKEIPINSTPELIKERFSQELVLLQNHAHQLSNEYIKLL